MAITTLSRAEGRTLEALGLAVRTYTEGLTTRTAIYTWNAALAQWDALQTGMRVLHATGSTGGWRWSALERRFVACYCRQCARVAQAARGD